MNDVYTHGHHESVLRSHKWRTAANSAAYLLPRLRTGQALLDVGCGPGTITVDLATRVAPGRVVGLDASADVISQAAALAHDHVEFCVGDVYALDFAEGSFDVVHAHQVLQHLSDPMAALREMRRVLKPGGVLAVRDSDYAAFVWAPHYPELDRWMDLYQRVTARNRAVANAGRYLRGWVQAAGFSTVISSSSTWTFADAESRVWWAGLWADRIVSSSFADQAMKYGFADVSELHEIADAFRDWAKHESGVFIVVHGEALADF